MNIQHKPLRIQTSTVVTFEEPVRLTRRKSWRDEEDVLVEKMTLSWWWEDGGWSLGGYGGISTVARRIKKDGTPFASETYDNYSMKDITNQTLLEAIVVAQPSQTITITEGNHPS